MKICQIFTIIVDTENAFYRFEDNYQQMLPAKFHENRKDDLILNMTPEKQDKTSELNKHWSPDSTPAKNEVIMKTTSYPVN